MNEEEIKEEIEKLKENCDCWLDDEGTDEAEREYYSKAKKTIQGLLELYNKEKESHKLDNENYKILQDDVTALAKYMGLEEDAIIDEMYEAFDQEKEKNKKLGEEKQQFVNGYTETMDKLGDCVINSYNQEKFYEKVINRMAKQISCLSRNLDNATNFERVSEAEYNIEFIKQYYFKKARGEENETN